MNRFFAPTWIHIAGTIALVANMVIPAPSSLSAAAELISSEPLPTVEAATIDGARNDDVSVQSYSGAAGVIDSNFVASFAVVPSQSKVYSQNHFLDCSPPGPRVADTRDVGSHYDPDVINQQATYGGYFRTVQNKYINVPGLYCNQFMRKSNIVADAADIYYTVLDGGSSYLHLVQNSATAGFNDGGAQLDILFNTGSQQYLGINPGYVAIQGSRQDGTNCGGPFASCPASSMQIYKMEDSSLIGVQTRVNGQAGGPFANAPQGDGTSFYWMYGAVGSATTGTLVSSNVDGTSLATIATNVSAFGAEGGNLFCTVDFTCQGQRRVYYGVGNQVKYHDMAHPSASDGVAYTSSDPAALIAGITSDKNSIFVAERHAGGTRQYNYTISRISLGFYGDPDPSTNGALTNEIVSDTGDLAPHDLQTDGTFLFWRANGNLYKMPNNAAVLPKTDLRITNLIVTQGLQNLNNTILLVQNKRTFAKLTAKSDGATVSNVTADLYATWDGGSGGPLHTGLQNVQASPDRFTYDHSFWFELPWDWTTKPNLRLRGELNPIRFPLQNSYANNSKSIGPFTFKPSPIVALNYIMYDADPQHYDRSGEIGLPDSSAYDPAAYVARMYPLSGVALNRNDPGLYLRIQHVINPRLTYGYDAAKGRAFCVAAGCTADDGTIKNVDLPNTWEPVKQYFSPGSRFFGTYLRNPDNGGSRGGISSATGPADSKKIDTQNYYPYIAGATDITDPNYGDVQGFVIAHEMGHSFNLYHSGCDAGPGGGSDASFPYSATGQMSPDDSVEGYNNRDKAVLQGTKWYDVMTYCSGRSDANMWFSDYNYQLIFNQMNNADAVKAASAGLLDDGGSDGQHLPTAVSMLRAGMAQTGNLVTVSGLTSPAPAGMILTARRITTGTVAATMTGPFAVRFINAGGAALATYPFMPANGSDGPYPIGNFNFTFTLPAGATAVQIVTTADGKVLDTKNLSPNPPSITSFTVPTASGVFTGSNQLSWTASDPDGDPLTYDLAYSRDNGATFLPLATGLPTTTFGIDSSALGGTNVGVFQVTANDGTNSASQVSVPFKVNAKAPQPVILQPANNASFKYGEVVNFEGIANDLQDEAIDPSKLVWSNQYGTIGTGQRITRTDLPVGANFITLKATNAAGMTGQTQITITITDDDRPLGPTLAVSPSRLSVSTGGGVSGPLTTTLSAINRGSGSLSWSIASDVPWITTAPISGTAPSNIVVTVDPGKAPAGVNSLGHLTVTGKDVLGGPTQTISVPVTLEEAPSHLSAASSPATSLPGANRVFIPATLISSPIAPSP